MSKIKIAYHVLYCSYTKLNMISFSVINFVGLYCFQHFLKCAKSVVFGLHIIYFVFFNMNYDHVDYNNALINAFVFKHAVDIKRAYACTSWATSFMSLCY